MTIAMSRLKNLRNGKDWHRAEIIAALHMHGTSVERLSRLNGFHTRSLSLVLSKPWPKGEAIIATALGLKSEDIWPSRHDGSVRRIGMRPASVASLKKHSSNAQHSTASAPVNVDAVDRKAA